MTAFTVPDRASGACVLALAAVLLSGCSTTDIDKIPHAIGGLPEGAPARPAQAPAFPAVHDMPPRRAAAPLDAEQQQRLEADLVALRNRQLKQQKGVAKDKGSAASQTKAKAKNPAKTTSGTPSGRSAPQSAATGQAAPGAPPWPLPSQTTGGSARP